MNEERQKRQAADNVASSSKTQLSHIAKEKHELEQRLKKAESAEGDLKRLTELNRTLEASNATLRVCPILLITRYLTVVSLLSFSSFLRKREIHLCRYKVSG